MPNPEAVMDVWPEEMENAFDQIGIPHSQLDLDLQSYSKVVLALLDVPYYANNSKKKGIIEGLHMMFSV